MNLIFQILLNVGSSSSYISNLTYLLSPDLINKLTLLYCNQCLHSCPLINAYYLLRVFPGVFSSCSSSTIVPSTALGL